MDTKLKKKTEIRNEKARIETNRENRKRERDRERERERERERVIFISRVREYGERKSSYTDISEIKINHSEGGYRSLREMRH